MTDKFSAVGVFKSFTTGSDNCRMTLFLFLGVPCTEHWGILQASGKHCLREASSILKHKHVPATVDGVSQPFKISC